MSKTKIEIFNIPLIQLKGFSIFLGFFIIFFLYHRIIVYGQVGLLVFVNSLILIIFIISCYKIKTGLYLFIFFIPLLNSLNTILRTSGADIILFLFLSLFMGFIVNKYKDRTDIFCGYHLKRIQYDRELYIPVVLFSLLVFMSCIITVYKYLNFLPFLSSKFNNLAVNLSWVRSENAIYWTLKWGFNAIVGIGLSLIIFNAFRKTRDVINAVIVIIASNIIVTVVGFYQHYLNPTFGSFKHWAEASRINATFTDPNSLGNYILILFPLYIILIIYFKRWYQKVILLTLFFAFLLMTLFSGSRNVFIGATISSIIFIVLGAIRLVKLIIEKGKASRIVRRIWISIASLLLVVFILFITMASHIVVQKPELKDMYRPPKTGLSLIDRSVDTIWMSYNVYRQAGFIEGFKSVSSERHFLWPQAIDMFTDHPVSGIGMGGFLIELPNYYEKNNPPVKILDFTGNYYLQILSELGIAGLLVLLAIFFFVLKRVFIFFYKKKNYLDKNREIWFLRGFLITFIATIIVLFFGPHTNFNEIQFTFWLIIGLMLVFIKIGENNREGISYSSGKGVLSLIMRPSLISKVSLSVIIIIFSINLLFSSLTGLSINQKRLVFGFEKSYGFYAEELIDGSPFRWAAMDASEMIENNHGGIIVPVKDSDPKDNRLPLFIRFFINNRFVKIVKIDDKEWHDISIDLSDISGERFILTMSCSRRWTPKDRGLSNDNRELGVMVGKFRFIE